MDSKYASIDADKFDKNQSLKRKNLLPKQANVKKIKLTIKVNNPNGTETDYRSNAKPLTAASELDNGTDVQDCRKRLPVYIMRGRILEEIKKNDTMIFIGETGSGKTTQIPQLIHSLRLEGPGTIAVTQPRRVAAITIAMRVAAEMTCELGSIVGYSVRFEDVSSPRTKVKYMTDGMLLREAMVDPLLKQYSFVILDEAHERTVSTDVLFGIIKLAQKERMEKNLNPLKIIIMSATMDVDSFSQYFNNCPVIYLEGRTYPVTIYHAKTAHEDYQYAAVCTIFQLHATAPTDYDFLVFLTGQEEIDSVMYNIKQIAKEAAGPPMKVCPLYAGLPPSRQLHVWRAAPPGARKVVLATNIAEASVTIPGIRYVIDSGMVKERTWCAASGAERLRVAGASRAACGQRAGRAGRAAPGAAYRLYTAADLQRRAAHTCPEIVRCPLAPTVLSLVALGAHPTSFPLMDAPPADSVRAALAVLRELGAIDDELNPKLTVVGKKMTAFPIDPRYSKILLSAPEYDCLEEALSVVALLSSESVFAAPLQAREAAVRARRRFESRLGDHVTMLNVYRAFCTQPLKKQWCKENYLHHKNLSYAAAVRRQLLAVCQRLRLPLASCGDNYDQLLRCCLAGLYNNCASLREGHGAGGRYVTAGGTAAALHPAGVLSGARPPPPAVLYTELLHTRRAYLVHTSAVQPAWLPRHR